MVDSGLVRCACCATPAHHDTERVVSGWEGLEFRRCDNCQHWSIGGDEDAFEEFDENPERQQQLAEQLLQVQIDDAVTRGEAELVVE